ncbi:hypothetical protein PssiTeo3_11390 [Pseudomonas sichuanensis]|nr:N-acetyl sugar amidotransferase [Pseudomonas sichuanensis]MDZ4017822.1 hypothetical protein [Pseudomonas sichuanensis]
MLKYCIRCVMPHTRPNMHIDEEGVCGACRSYEKRSEIDWDRRKHELLSILEKHRSSGDNWDCIVPVSGGKDSTYQVIRMLQLGLNPLCVTSSPCDETAVGRQNLQNLKSLGVDHVEFSPNPRVRAALNRIGLVEVGDISWPEHVGIFTLPVRAAVQYGVPLIVWGENPQNEYGGPTLAAENTTLTRHWLDQFGGLLGLSVPELSIRHGLESRHLIPYQYPSDEALQRIGVTGLFLGHYLPWDGLSNALIAQANGFVSSAQVVEGSMVNYENLDNHQSGIHDYFKYLKFGFSRVTDHACLHVRRGRMTRLDAVEIVRAREGKFPWTYLGKPLSRILEPLEMSTDEFIEVCDRFTNRQIFKCDDAGRPLKDAQGNLIKQALATL